MRTVRYVSGGKERAIQKVFQEPGLEGQGPMRVTEVPTLKGLSAEPCDLVIVDKDVVDERLIEELQAIRRQAVVPILLATNQVPVTAYQRLSDLRGMMVVQKPITHAAYASLIDRALSGQILAPDCTPRFLTNEPVRALDTKTGLVFTTRMRNYSPTGAFLEYKGISVQVGTRLKLDFVNNKDRSPRTRVQFDAKVIWIRGGHGSSESRGFGVQFLNDVSL